jgi:membrane protein implicated in regulation of membrane protease activity
MIVVIVDCVAVQFCCLRAKAIGLLLLSVAILVQGSVLAFVPIAPSLTALGFFLMALGAVMLLVVTGVFSGTPYRSGILNRYERDRKRRAQRRAPD